MIERPNFISAHSRERARLLTSVVEECRRAVGAIALKHTWDTSYVADFDTYLNGLFLPNNRHGQLSIPFSYRNSDRTPVVFAEADVPHYLDKTFLDQTPLQIERTRALLTKTQMAEFEHTRKQLKRARHLDAPTFALKATAAAVTEAFGVKISRNEHNPISVWTRPLVILPPNILRYVVAPLKFHEYIHVQQLYRSPVQTTDSDSYRMRNELEAYDWQNEFTAALLRTDLPEYPHETVSNKTVSQIASICNLNPPDDRHAPSKPVRQILNLLDINI